ncbi:MAG: redoxin family protein [Verrucomicrobiota bacterium]
MPILAVILILITGCNRPATPATGVIAVSPLVGKPAPSLDGALVWLNSEELTLDNLRGKVVLLHFFDYSCLNNIHTYPYLLEWKRRYTPLGLQVIGIHSPEFDFGLLPSNVQDGVNRAGLTHPIAVDSDLKITGAYHNRYWPRLLLLDKAGIVSFDHTGEGKYAEAEFILQKLLRELNPQAQLPPVMAPVHDFDRTNAVCYVVTPGLYLGRARGDFGNHEAASTNAIITFHLPAERDYGVVYAQGDWSIHDEYMRHAVDQDDLTDCLTLRYQASDLNVVMKPEDVYWLKVFVEQDGQPIPKDYAGTDISYDADDRSFVKVDRARLYNLTHRQPHQSHEVRLSMRGKGLSVYGFSFGTSAIPKDAAQFRQLKAKP